MTHKRRILVLYAHPNPMQSRAQKALSKSIEDLEHLEIRDLYRLYPQFYIDVAAEQEALLRADLVIFQHPIYWHSAPALLKEWQDAVLRPGFAYGSGGTALHGKDFLQVLTAGGMKAVYQSPENPRFELSLLLRPYEATAVLCGMNFHPPYIIQAINALTEKGLDHAGLAYRQLLLDYQETGSAALLRAASRREEIGYE